MKRKRPADRCGNPARPPDCPLGREVEGGKYSDLFDEGSWTAVGSSLDLSPRQLQLVRAVFDDQTEYAIAVDLGIAQSTVHTHFERLYQKLGVHDRVQLVTRWMASYFGLLRGGSTGLTPVCPHIEVGNCPLIGEFP